MRTRAAGFALYISGVYRDIFRLYLYANFLIYKESGGARIIPLTDASDDLLSLTSGNDTVTGDAGELQTGDVIVDGSGTDADIANVVVTTAAKPTMTNVETANFSFALGAGALDASAISGTDTFGIKSAEAGAVAAEVMKAKTGNLFDVDSGIQTFTLDTGGATDNTETATVKVNGTSGSAGLTLNLDATGATAANDVDVLTINSTGDSNTVTLGTAGAIFAATGEKIVATGDQDLKLKTGATADANGLDGATVENSLTGDAELTVEYTGALDAAHDLSKVAADLFVFSGAAAAGADVTVASGVNVQLKGDYTGTGPNPITSKTDNGTLNLNATVSQSTNKLSLDKFSTVNVDVTDTVTFADFTLGNAATLNNAKVVVTGSNSDKTLTLTVGYGEGD